MQIIKALLVAVTLGSMSAPAVFAQSLEKKLQGLSADEQAAILMETPAEAALRQAKRGDVRAQYDIGARYASGHGVIQNYAEAEKWLRKAANQGSARAQRKLAGMYEDGEGVNRDYKAAVKLYRKASEQGDEEAQFKLSQMYGNGRGVSKDKVLAHMWANIAASNGQREAASERQSLERWMSNKKIKKAQKLARECVQKNYKNC